MNLLPSNVGRVTWFTLSALRSGHFRRVASIVVDVGSVEPIVYAGIWESEYGCCGDVPVPGARVDGIAHARPAPPNEQFIVTEPFTWVRDLDLLRFADFSAYWDPADGDPTGQPFELHIIWHTDLLGRPTVVGAVREALEMSCGVDTPRSYRRVETAKRHNDIDSPVFGLIAGFVAESSIEPTAAEFAERSTRDERDSRTIYLEGPATAFGDTVPARDEHVRVDLDDPRLTVTQNRIGASGVVGGVTRQVSMTVPFRDTGVSMLPPAPAGAPTESAPRDLFVVLVVDRESLSP